MESIGAAQLLGGPEVRPGFQPKPSMRPLLLQGRECIYPKDPFVCPKSPGFPL